MIRAYKYTDTCNSPSKGRQSENAPDEDTLHGVSDELPLGDHLVPVLVTHAQNLLPTRTHILTQDKQYYAVSGTVS